MNNRDLNKKNRPFTLNRDDKQCKKLVSEKKPTIRHMFRKRVHTMLIDNVTPEKLKKEQAKIASK